MKKQDIAGIIVYIIILALAAVFGLVVIREFSSKSNLDTLPFIFLVAGAIISGVIINSILYEVAHIIGAKIGGYLITSVSVLGFTFAKEAKGWRFRFASFDGLTGETKIIPNTKRKKPANPIPYLVAGTIVYAIEVVVVVLLFSIFTREGASFAANNIAYFLIIFMAVGGIIVFYNIIPLQLDSMTDGYRLRLVSGKKNRDAFNKMLLGETDDEPVVITDGEKDEPTSFSSNLKLNQVYQFLNNEEYAAAEELVDSILETAKEDKKITNKTLFEVKAHKIFLVIVNQDIEKAREYCEANLSVHERKSLSEENELTYLRAYVLVAGLIDRSKSECTRILDKVYKSYRKTPESKRALESKLFNVALQLVVDKHPDWGLEEYKINA